VRKVEESRQKSLSSVKQSDLKKDAAKDPTRMRPYMGFKVEPFSSKAGPALRVTTVAESSPAAEGGVLPGDVLLRFANYKATDLAGFNAIVSRHAIIGKELPIQLQRGAEKLEKNITVAGRFPDA
jgi:S1-C subfamily serine protease